MSYRQAISVDLPNGARFVSQGLPETPRAIPHLEGCSSPDEVVAQINGMWARTLRASQPEIQRLRMLELAYLGFHYRDPRSNRENEITNHCFSVVEGQWPHMTKDRPRPECVPRHAAIDKEAADKIEETAVWWQDMSGADHIRRVNERVKLKYGYCLYVLNVDFNTGFPYVVDWSPFNFYPDHSASNFRTMEFFFLAGPCPTRLLKHMFPHKAGDIVSDNYVSPSYDATVRPYWEQHAYYGDRTPDLIGPYAAGMTNTGLGGFDYTGGGPSGATTFAFSSPNAVRQEGSDTTFFVQCFVRDRSMMPCVWQGSHYIDGADGPFSVSIPGATYEDQMPCCPSGWRVIQVTGNGVYLDEAPLDECYGGLNLVIDYDYEHEGMVRGVGEIDNVLPMNRWINRRKMLLNRSLEHEGTPVLVVTKGSGIDFNSSGVEPGDVLEPVKGSEVQWLEYNGPSEHQFEQLARESQDVDVVSGRTDVQQGQRPPGIEAAAAIRELQGASNIRIDGKRPGAHDAWSLVVRKALRIMSKKMKEPLSFVGSGGQIVTIHPNELDLMYDIRMAEGSGKATSRKDKEEMALQLYSMGLLTPVDVLEAIQWPDYEKVGMRVMQFQMIQAAAGAQGKGGKGEGGQKQIAGKGAAGGEG